MYRTFGAPSGATGWRYGSQSGVESRSSTLMMPLNGLVMPRPFQAAPRPASPFRGDAISPAVARCRDAADGARLLPEQVDGPLHRDGPQRAGAAVVRVVEEPQQEQQRRH